MARVAGVDLPREKRGEVAVTYIYGLGRSTGRRVLLKANVDPSKRVKAWTDDEVNRIRELIVEHLTGRVHTGPCQHPEGGEADRWVGIE